MEHELTGTFYDAVTGKTETRALTKDEIEQIPKIVEAENDSE